MEAMKRTKVHTSPDKIEADMLVVALKNNNISAYRQGCGSGGYMDIYAGNSIFGEDIYVDESDAEGAKEIIQELTGGEGELETAPNDEVSEKDYKNKKKGIGRLIVFVYLLCFIGMILFSAIKNAF